MYESGDRLAHVLFPTDRIVSPLYAMANGASGEIAASRPCKVSLLRSTNPRQIIISLQNMAPMNAMQQDRPAQWVRIHPLIVRIAHWINALAILVMVTSGWRIYNASPLFDFRFPGELTLGGWLAGALQWHFAAMWLLVANGLVYAVYGVASGHFRRKLLPIGVAAVLHDVGAALRGRLAHDDLGVYNAAQRAAYVAIIVAGIVLVLSGLAVWKPVQLQALAALFGGYEGARLVHFAAMAVVVLFVLLHLAMVILVPRTLPTMITGRARRV